ncbi:SUI1 [Malassezia furfur]|nr:SUI1 [Malassezia furfur]
MRARLLRSARTMLDHAPLVGIRSSHQEEPASWSREVKRIAALLYGFASRQKASFNRLVEQLMSIQNLASYDPFADVGEDQPIAEDPVEDKKKASQVNNYVHIRIQQRNGRKTLTTLQGLPKEYDAKKLLKAFKKEFACNGTIVDDEELGQVIQLQGDQRQKISMFLIEEGIPKQDVKVHGF